MTGAEMKAWRERLGKDEAWAKSVLNAVSSVTLCPVGNASARLVAAESERGHMGYSSHETAALRTAYRAALEAEEARQAAERAQAEPVCPEGVGKDECGDGDWIVTLADAPTNAIWVKPDGRMTTSARQAQCTPALLRYAADLSEYRARKHAEGDRQRKLDAVRAAHEAYDRACLAKSEARRAAEDASKAASDAFEAMNTARREAGL